MGFSSCGRPNLRAQSLRPLRPLYKREEENLLFVECDHQESDRRRESHRILREKEKRRENLCFFFTTQISSKVQSRFVCGPIDLKFGGEVHDSLVFNMNGFGVSNGCSSVREQCLCFGEFFYSDSF